ncbi:uncharacterized protein [Malus domestica]|uniref:uncharacterized protein n=1 Tax=Malus domestica TaxID=3750 RepID=UPI003975E7B2
MKNSLLDGMVGTSNHTYSYLVRIPHVCSPGCYARSGSPLNVGDLLNFLSAIFFEIHMLRTEHISGSTKKENFFAILGYDVCVVALLSKIWVFIGGLLDGTDYSNQSPWTWTELWDWIVAFQWIPAIYTGAFSTGLCLRIEIFRSSPPKEFTEDGKEKGDLQRVPVEHKLQNGLYFTGCCEI